MIIACPECTSPFQVLDNQIAALLQIECPTCTFRMILDFEAANDAGLREEGMQYAQGFRDEATYRQAVGAGESYSVTEPAAAKPELRAVPTPEPEPEPEQPVVEQPTAEPVRRPAFTPAPEPAHAPVTPPVTPTPVQPQPEPARAKPPVRAKPTLIAHTAPPPVRLPTEPIPPRPTTAEVEPPPTEAAIDTHVGPPPNAEIAAPVEVSRPADEAQLEVPADEFSVDLDEPDVESEPRVTTWDEPRPVLRPEPQLRTPPHTPATPSTPKPVPEAATDATTDAGADEATEVPAIESEPPKDEQPGKRGGALRTVFLMFLLLILMGAAGLMGWSVIETQDPNPLPMLKDKFGIDLGFGIPAQPAPEPEKAAGDKAGPQ